MYDVDELIKIYKRREGIAGETAKALEHLKSYETGPTFTAEDVCNILVEHGQNDHQFKLGEIIKYSPTDVYDILKEASK